MYFYWLVIGLVCTWRVAHLLWAEDGPWQVIARVRRRAGTGFWGGLMDCFNCASLWVAAPFAVLLGDSWAHTALLWLASSPAARSSFSASPRASARSLHPISSIPIQSGEHDGVLRKGESTIERNRGWGDAGS